MTEHVHEWVYERDDDDQFYYCTDKACRRNEYPLSTKEVVARLNATERLSAPRARGAANLIKRHGLKNDDFIAYADTLEGK